LLIKYNYLPTHPIHPIKMDNARYSCITAAAGTCISHSFDLHLYQNFKSIRKLYSFLNLPHPHQIARSYICILSRIPHCC